MQKNGNRVIIIGAGIAGLMSAYFLNKSGLNVTVLDKNSGSDNCSSGNAGMIVPSHIVPLASPGIITRGIRWMFNPESPFSIRIRFDPDLWRWCLLFKKSSTADHVERAGPVLRDLLMEGRTLLCNLKQEENLHFGLTRRGLFMFCNTQSGLDKEAKTAEKANKLGIQATVLSPDEVRKKEPVPDLAISGAVYYPQDGHLVPELLTDQLKSLLSKKGVKFNFHTNISSFKTENEQIIAVCNNRGKKWRGEFFVLTAGIWSRSLAAELGLNIPMQPGKGYSITLKNPNLLPVNCGIFAEKKVTMTPMLNNLRFAGTMEIGNTSPVANKRKLYGLKKTVCEYIPDFDISDFDGLPVWSGLRPCSPDGLPYVGPVRRYKNLYLSTGHAMLGMSLAPACGKLVSDLITSGRSEFFHSMIRPDRYL